MRTLTGVVVVVIAAAGCVVTPRVSLDATTITVRPEPGHSVEAGTLPGSGPPPLLRSYPLRVELIRLDRAHYRRMDRIKYDVRIENVSADSVVMPWSPAPIALRNRPATGYRHALFELMVVRAGAADWAIDTFVLYGSPTVEGSLRDLRPGEIVTVRLAAVLSGSGFQDSRNPVLYPTAGMKAKVGMMIYAPNDERFRFFHEEMSSPSLAFSIRPPAKL